MSVRRQIAEILVEDQHEVDAVVNVEAQHTVERLHSDGIGLRSKRGGLAECTAEAAAPRGEKNAYGKRPAARQAEPCDQRRMLDLVEAYTKLLRDSVFAIACEDMIEMRADGGRQGAVIPGPKFADAGAARLRGQIEDVVGFFEVEGKADHVPTLLELRGKLGAGWIFENGQVRNILAQKAQAKRDIARHAKAPAKIARSVFTKIIVEARIAATRGQQDPRHDASSVSKTGGPRHRGNSNTSLAAL